MVVDVIKCIRSTIVQVLARSVLLGENVLCTNVKLGMQVREKWKKVNKWMNVSNLAIWYNNG